MSLYYFKGNSSGAFGSHGVGVNSMNSRLCDTADFIDNKYSKVPYEKEKKKEKRNIIGKI